MLRTISPLLLAFVYSTTLLAQVPGSNDAMFNPGDYGHGVGDAVETLLTSPYPASTITCTSMDANGRIVWGGSKEVLMWGTYPVVGRLNANDSPDLSFPAAYLITGAIDAVAGQADGKILVGGAFSLFTTTSATNLMRLNANGTLDTTFMINPSWGAGATRVRAIAVQPDGKILIGGTFTAYNGQTVANLTRLNSDGTRDTSWPSGNLGGANGAVHAIILQPDGNVVIGGDFTVVGLYGKGRIARLLPPFDLTWEDGAFAPGTGANGVVRTLAIQPDGSILAGGDFTSMSGSPCERIMRLTSTGSLDPSFDTSPGFDASVRSVAVRSDGAIAVCGDFTTYAGTARPKLAVIASTGNLLTAFDPGPVPTAAINRVVARSTGKVVAFGAFSGWNGVFAGHYMRLTSTGAIDNTFAYNGISGTAQGVAVQSDGRIIVGGGFVGVNGLYRQKLTRLMPNGSVDPSFPTTTINGTSHIDDYVYYLRDVAVQPDDKILVAGALGAYATGTERKGLVRLLSNGTMDVTFNSGLSPVHAARAITLQPDGKILAAYGSIDAEYQPTSHPCSFKRFNIDGSTDATFTIGSAASYFIHDSGILPDGRVMLVGDFNNYASTGRNRILRLNADGTVDGSFNYITGFAGGTPRYVLPSTDGKCFVSGSFTAYDGNPANGLLRLNEDGSFDASFAPTVQGGGPLMRDYIGKLVVSARYRLNEDGSLDPSYNVGTGFTNAIGYSHPLATAVHQGGVIAVGDFTALNGIGRNHIARIAGVAFSDMALPMRALLEGPFVSATNLMNDGLRVAGLIPTTEPFTALGFTHVAEGATPTIAPSVFNPTVPVFGSIVDWVMVELRSPSNPAQVLQTRTGLIQRDGDIVGTDGVSPLVFNRPLGSYYVAVRHRNHAGCMTAAPIVLSTTNAMLNFSLPTTATYGTEGQKPSGTRMVLWAGDATHNGTIKYTGSANDRDPILVKVGSTTPNASAAGYFTEDVNMDGTVKYTGTANDRDPILVNVGSTTPNNVRVQSLP